MSQNNRTDQKPSARERLREQRAEADRRAKRKRTLVVSGVVVAVLAVAGGVGALVSASGDTDSGDSGPVAAPQGASGQDALVITTGRADAPATLTVYEDFRCPGCGQFETGFRDTIRGLEKKGTLKTEYHLVTLIDNNVGGSGSLAAANAAACAQDAGKFSAYHDVLYRNQPQETDDAFADRGSLVRMAGKVPALDTETFRSCVRDGAHDGWVKKSNSAFAHSDHNATPTVLLNGRDVYGDQRDPLTPQRLRKLVEEIR